MARMKPGAEAALAEPSSSRQTRLYCALALLAAQGCAGQGEGQVSGTVHIPVCKLDGAYDLHADFFGGTRYNNTDLFVRIQNGGGTQDYTDNVMIEFADTEEVRRRLLASTDTDAQGNRQVKLAVGPQGMSDAIVHATFTPNHSCGRVKVSRFGQTVGLWAYDGWVIVRSIDRGPTPPIVDAGASDGGVVSDDAGTLNDGFTDVSAFDIRFHDPRPVGSPAPDGIDPASPIGDAEFTGFFRFEHSRAVPGESAP